MEATKGKKSSVSSKLSSKENNQQASTTGATAGATSTEESNNSEDDADQLLDNYNTEDVDAHDYSNVNHVIFACDANLWVLVQWVLVCYVINLKSWYF